MEEEKENIKPLEGLTLPDISDPNLRAWNRWAKIRREDTTKLSIMLDKPPVDLAMNLLYKERGDKERKQALEYAQIKRKIGTQGKQWGKLHTLKPYCPCAPVYEIHQTKAERGKPPVIQHVSVPKYIRRKELGADGIPERMPCTLLNTEYYDYREKREKEFQKELQKIFPYNLDDNLLIKGKRPSGTPPKKFDIPLINIGLALPELQAPTSVYALKIKDTVFYKNVPGQNLEHLKNLGKDDPSVKCTSWTLYINAPIKRVGHNKLVLQNLGTVVLNYSWKKLKSHVPKMIVIPPTTFEQVFFFNVNEDVVCPGQVKEIVVTFLAETPGRYTETWELCVHDVEFIKKPKPFLLHLLADAVEDMEDINRKIDTFQNRLYRKMLKGFALGFINEIIENIFIPPPQIYPYEHNFLEANLFELINPVYFYHQTDVQRMKLQYTEMVKDGVWDLSIASWRSALMTKKFDERMMYFHLLQSYHRDLLKPWYEGDDLAFEKYRAVKYLLGQLFDKFDTEYMEIGQRLVNYESYTLNARKEVDTKEEVDITPKSKQKPGTSNRSSGKSTNRSATKKSNKQVTTKEFTNQAATNEFTNQPASTEFVLDPFNSHVMRMIFFMRIREHFKDTLESCAGILSSIDLNKFIDYDFCRNS